MNYIAAIVSLVATAILTLPILYITDDRITTEKEKFKASVKAKKKEPDDKKNWVCIYQYTLTLPTAKAGGFSLQ